MKLHRKYMQGYKKNTLSLLMAITLSITLFVALFTLFHTSHKIQTKQNQFVYSAIDYQLSGLDMMQIDKVKKTEGIEHLGISRNSGMIYTNNKQSASLIEANKDEVQAVSKLVEGRMPTKTNEIVAEKWALLNLGISPKINSFISLDVKYTENDTFDYEQTRTYKIVGILKDMNFSKRAGIISLYTNLSDRNSNDYIVTIKWKENKEKSIQMLKKNLKLSSEQIVKNPWAENTEELLKWDIEIGLILGGVFVVILYGVFRIFFIARERQYGILRAVGAKNKQIRLLILRELFEIYLISIPIGICIGVLGAYIVTLISKDREIDIYFWGIKETFQMVFPIPQLILGIILVGFIIVIISLVYAHRVNQKNIMNTINGVDNGKYKKFYNGLQLKNRNIISIEKILSLKYMNKNFSSTLFLLFSIIVVVCLFYGLGFQAKLGKSDNEIAKELNFYNSDYIITSNDDMSSDVGITEETLLRIKEIKGIGSIETQSAMPIKVFENGVEKNQKYLEYGEKFIKQNYGFSLSNTYNDRKVFLTKMKGYTENALEKLKRYVVDGDYNSNKMENNQVIIAMPRTITKGTEKGKTGFFKNGEPIVNYQVGDKIEVAYHKSFNTSSMEYWKCQDSLKDYEIKELEVVAVVYYPYMKTMSPLEQNYPLFIVSEKQYSNWIPLNLYESVNINLDNIVQKDESEIEEELIELSVKNEGITARSMIAEKRSLDIIYHKKLVYIYGISIVTFVLMIINLINNLQYRIYVRKMEYAIYRAIGMKNRLILKMITFENRVICLISLIIAFCLTHFIAPILFEHSQLFLYGIYYKYSYGLYITLSFVALVVCEIIIRRIVTKQHKQSIVSIISSNE